MEALFAFSLLRCGEIEARNEVEMRVFGYSFSLYLLAETMKKAQID